MRKRIDVTGSRYGRWVVVSYVGDNKFRGSTWLCRCDCGNEVVVNYGSLRSGESKSCGCLQKELVAKRNKWNSGIKHSMYIDGRHCGWSKTIQREFHESIRKRDNYTCQKCGKSQEQELLDIDGRLSVHHKDGDHFNNTDENTTTLCTSCHVKVERKSKRMKQNAELSAMINKINAGDYSDLIEALK